MRRDPLRDRLGRGADPGLSVSISPRDVHIWLSIQPEGLLTALEWRKVVTSKLNLFEFGSKALARTHHSSGGHILSLALAGAFSGPHWLSAGRKAHQG